MSPARHRPAQRRLYPIEPLLACREPEENCVDMLRHLGCSGSAWRLAKEQGLTEAQADRWACAYGRHPSELWPEWFEHAPAWTPDEQSAVAS